MLPRLVNAALGVWLMSAPAVLGYVGSSAVAEASDRIIGPLLTSFAIAAIWPEIRPLRWANVGLGALLVVVPPVVWALRDWPLAGLLNSVAVGIVVVLTARIRGPVDAEFGGGWRSVWRDDIDTIHGDPYPDR